MKPAARCAALFESGRYKMTMDARAGVRSLIEVDADRYGDEIALKERILQSDPAYYFQCPPDAEPLAWEALEALLPEAAGVLPQYFGLTRDGTRWTWANRLLGTQTTFSLRDPSSLPQPPLDWLARQVQEDLILMAANADGETVCAGGHLCFGSGWSLGEKMGRTFAETHAPVPEFAARIGPSSDLLMRRLKAERPVERLNWTIHATDALNLAPALAHEWQAGRFQVTPDNAGERCFLRLERQTLVRLPRTGGVLFTIHTYLHALKEIAADPEQARRLASVIRAMPSATLQYKGMTAYVRPLLAYLDRLLERDL